MAVSAGFAGLRTYDIARASGTTTTAPSNAGFGPLIPDPQGVLDLPKGFRYRVISQIGRRMDDGLFVPGQPDGMGAFPGPNGHTILIRNHELNPGPMRKGPFGWHNELLNSDTFDKTKLYADRDDQYAPRLGGTTTLIYDTQKHQLVSEYLSLAGTWRNCAGGVTPWGTWVTCEEPIAKYNDKTLPAGHGYCFEVRPHVKPTLTDPIPIKAMGRFNHEAIAVDPNSGAVYQSEDRDEGLIYRYLPNKPGHLHAGGRLQALAMIGAPSLITDNHGEHPAIPIGQPLPVRWIDLQDVDAPADDLRFRGFDQGAASFARCEGMWYGNACVYIAATTGGPNQKGQIWRYTPSPVEGTAEEADQPGTIELFLEPNDHALIEHADNLTVAPWGDLIICEDASQYNELVGVTPQGELYRIGYNQLSKSELAGAVFSPDGSTLFVNIQAQGITLAITGPWRG